jgi:ABC-type nitrate/sulfonate/bicarbonate transport system substrate-binding protein
VHRFRFFPAACAAGRGGLHIVRRTLANRASIGVHPASTLIGVRKSGRKPGGIDVGIWLRRLGLALIALPLTAIAADAGAATADNTHSLTVLESTPGFFDLPLRNAIADFAPKYHLDIRVVTVTGGGGLATEFEGGTGSIALVGADTPLRLAQADAVPGGITIIGTNMTNMLYALIARTDSPYHGLTDLRGKNVGITGAGAASEVVLKWALNTKAHMSPSELRIVPLGPPVTILQAVLKGSVAAGTVFSPALDEGLSSGQVRIIFDFRQYPYGSNVFMVRTRQKADPTPFRLFMQAYNDAVSKMYADLDYTMKSAMKYWGQGTTADVVRSELAFYMDKEWKDTRFTQALYEASRDVLLNSGTFPKSNFPSYDSLTRDVPHE